MEGSIGHYFELLLKETVANEPHTFKIKMILFNIFCNSFI